MGKQPDFHHLYRNFFYKTDSKTGKVIPRKICYSIRDYPDRNHDLIFMKSLLHDAIFTRENVVFHKNRWLTITINRDCWELGYVQHPRSVELYTTTTKLSIYPALSWEWRFSHKQEFDRTSDLYLHSIRFEQPDDNSYQVVLVGHEWSLRINTKEFGMKMLMQDQMLPALWSQKG